MVYFLRHGVSRPMLQRQAVMNWPVRPEVARVMVSCSLGEIGQLKGMFCVDRRTVVLISPRQLHHSLSAASSAVQFVGSQSMFTPHCLSHADQLSCAICVEVSKITSTASTRLLRQLHFRCKYGARYPTYPV